jgi:outer membrane protein assembly factor BamB
VKFNGVDQIIISATNRIRSYKLSNGEILWECGGMTTNVIPHPHRRS